MKPLLILCVVYNKQIYESITLESLQSIRFVDGVHYLLIWNNGPETLALNSSVYLTLRARFKSVTIMNGLNNSPLSVIYNRSLYYCSADVDSICILDDDSDLPVDFLDEYYKSKYLLADMYMPLVWQDGELVSPVRPDGIRFKSLDPGVYSAKQINGIASGMIIPKATLSRERFDERFFFYGADTEYLLRMGSTGANVYVFNACIMHSLSTDVSRNAAFSLFKYRSLLQAFCLIGVLYNRQCYYFLKMLRCAVRQSLFSRSISPFGLGIVWCYRLLARRV